MYMWGERIEKVWGIVNVRFHWGLGLRPVFSFTPLS